MLHLRPNYVPLVDLMAKSSSQSTLQWLQKRNLMEFKSLGILQMSILSGGHHQGGKKKAAARLKLLLLNISPQVPNFLHKKFSQHTSLNFHFLTSFKQSFPGKIQPYFCRKGQLRHFALSHPHRHCRITDRCTATTAHSTPKLLGFSPQIQTYRYLPSYIF